MKLSVTEVHSTSIFRIFYNLHLKCLSSQNDNLKAYLNKTRSSIKKFGLVVNIMLLSALIFNTGTSTGIHQKIQPSHDKLCYSLALR